MGQRSIYQPGTKFQEPIKTPSTQHNIMVIFNWKFCIVEHFSAHPMKLSSIDDDSLSQLLSTGDRIA